MGRTTFVFVDPSRADRTLTVDAWYPVDADEGCAPELIPIDEAHRVTNL